jgi:hypothetical protein
MAGRGLCFARLGAAMSNPLRIVLGVVLAIVLMPSTTAAGTVKGTVTNGTTGKIAVGVDVILIELQGGMQTVENTKTDDKGEYHFTYPQLGVGPMLIRVVYKGVNYHQPAVPGKDDIPVEIYEPTNDARAFSVDSRFLVFEPKDSSLIVGEEYDIENHTQPPMTFSHAGGSFSFYLPPNGQLQQVSALGPGGMPVQQGTIDRGNNVQSIDFPFRPGQNNIRVSYTLPYAGNQATVHTVSPYAAKRVLIVLPPTMQVLSAGFSPAGAEQGFNVYSRDSVAANDPVDISISGTAPPPEAAANGGNGSGDEAGGGGENSAPVPTGEIVPSRIDNVKWIVIACFAAIFALGAVMLLRRTLPFEREGVAASAGSAGNTRPFAQGSTALSGVSPPAFAPATSPAMQQTERAVQGSLDAIKDRLFRLELRRQAGTLTEAEYVRQRGEAEKVLHDLLQD